MFVTIELNQTVVGEYQKKAQAEHISLEQLLAKILNNGVMAPVQVSASFTQTPEAIMAQVCALPLNPSSVTPAQGSLLETLQSAPDDPNFNLDEWKQAWAQAEAEIKAITRQNDRQEGRA